MNTKIILLSLLLFVSLNANEKNFFISQGVGISKHKVIITNKTGNIILDNQPSNTGNSLNLELGYRYSNNYFSTFSYSNLSYTEIEINNVLISFNKRFKVYSFDPYVGILYGTSNLKLKKSLINGSTKQDDGQSNIYGIQFAIQKKVNTNSYIYLQYKYLKTNHKRVIQKSGDISELSRDNFNNISLGIKYDF